MSKFWESLPKNLNEGIISKDRPFIFEHKNVKVTDDIVIDIMVGEPVSNELVYFIAENGISANGNSYILNPKIANKRVTTYIKSKGNILGFAISIPHTLRFKELIFKTGITTNLCVSLKHRKLDIARYLISSIINWGYEHQIYTGYHYINEPRTDSNIHTYTYFRPLNLKMAADYGYEIPQMDYTTKSGSDYKIRKSEFEDYELCKKINRTLSINFEKQDFENITYDCESLTVMYKNKVVGLVILKPVLLSIGKIGKLCPIVRIVFMEMIDKHDYNVISKIIEHLAEMNKFSVMSGVCFGNLNNHNLRNKLGFVTSGQTYLDFYNFHFKEINRNANEINLLYI
jgi:hypothetical protein